MRKRWIITNGNHKYLCNNAFRFRRYYTRSIDNADLYGSYDEALQDALDNEKVLRVKTTIQIWEKKR